MKEGPRGRLQAVLHEATLNPQPPWPRPMEQSARRGSAKLPPQNAHSAAHTASILTDHG